MMLHPQFPFRLYLVISEADCKHQHFLLVAEEAIKGGVDIIQLREKNVSTAAFIEKAYRLKEITDRYNVPLIINDNLEVAMEVDAAGIHVGNSDLPPVAIRSQWNKADKLIGYSIEYMEQLSNEQTEVADYLGISPIFSTNTKTDTITEWGLQGISTIRKQTQQPLVAIGNMNISNARLVLQAGADCIAVVSAICGSVNPQKAASELLNELVK